MQITMKGKRNNRKDLATLKREGGGNKGTNEKKGSKRKREGGEIRLKEIFKD